LHPAGVDESYDHVVGSVHTLNHPSQLPQFKALDNLRDL